jgi:predicted transcriptional regulator
MPEIVGAKLLTRGLIERREGRFSLTARGRIALAKLG